MCTNKELNMLDASKTMDTQAAVIYAEQHEELTDHTTAIETMQEQQTQVETQEEARPHFLDAIPYLPASIKVDGEVVTTRKEGHFEKKKRNTFEKQFQKAKAAEQKLTQTRNAIATRTTAGQASSVGYKNERTILDKQLTLIQAQEDADLAAVDVLIRQQKDGVAEKSADPASSVEALTAKVKWAAQDKRYEAYHQLALSMEIGSEARINAMKKAEDEKVQADVLKRKYKVACMPLGAERTREDSTISRHERYDMLKGIFRKPSIYSREDAELTFTDENADVIHLSNIGRATMGGTKAMYEFKELHDNAPADEVPQQWLFKEATNCIGMAKPSGAIVTGAAYLLQKQLRGDLSIPAYCVRVDNKVVGSIQKKMQRAEGGVDLFKWQAQEDLTVNAPDAVTMNDLMNEHTLDWVLCNFDTKGENFINQAAGHIISFDKEASFNKLLDDGSLAMSYTYKPHSNDTIYNTMFRAYAEGTIDLDLFANEESIRSIEAQDVQHYVDMFRDTLDAKYKAGSNDRSEAEERLKNRFRTLRETYRTFYTNLIHERLSHFQGDSEEHQQERTRLNAYLHNDTFRFRDEQDSAV